MDVSSDYTAHCWTKDPIKLVVINTKGDIIVCQMSGEFQAYVRDSPFAQRLECILPYSRGFYIGGQDGRIYQYESTPDENVIYELTSEIKFEDREKFKDVQIPPSAVGQLAISNELEDMLYYVDRCN